MIIEIDKNSGFCFGVVEAIRKAEETLQQQDVLYCLGDIVHNDAEVKRLTRKGLITIDHERYLTMKDTTVLLRAHGEPPSTYEYARQNNIRLIDATCPVVLKLQQRIRKGHELTKSNNAQFIIFGKKGHAEVNGLVGQTNGKAIVLESTEEIDKVDFTRPIELYSQTTKDLEGFHLLADELKRRAINVPLKIHDTVCRQVANRIPAIRKFSARFGLIIFVSGQKSSNGKMLFDICQSVNHNSKFISSIEEIDIQWIKDVDSVGICGATSTPKNLLEEVAEGLSRYFCFEWAEMLK
ncbi:MAG: 4-hydroxy-3-methylbut-2-enyl diphosphate reductase [Bacteroidia bacterium]|nr:4-hydroxy-3-methylbut-2-enyl diphosphate reductase [Bacteroidia bacterium]